MQWVIRQFLYQARQLKVPVRHFIRYSRLSVKRSHNLYIWSKDSVANSVFIGLFCAMLPLPSQMIVAGIAALAVRAYLPLAVALVWLSNPVTFIPLAWASLIVGCALMGVDSNLIAAAEDAGFASLFGTYWMPLLAGSLTLGFVISIIGYWLTRLAWGAFELSKLKPDAKKALI